MVPIVDLSLAYLLPKKAKPSKIQQAGCRKNLSSCLQIAHCKTAKSVHIVTIKGELIMQKNAKEPRTLMEE
ncbi:hypothetical protein P8452_25617 [Trifolium repens]|nr:hypothetical protein P8452_25613 [Trifolium repens]WJX37898.1 hypothetical protein P8452_25617 [Trifolium repens]